MNTMQHEFDAVVEHLFKQGRPAKQKHFCKYRTEDGLSCAVGCRIPDEMYTDDMEARNASYLIDGFNDGKYSLPSELPAYKDMFTELQRVHDGWPNVGSLEHPMYHKGDLDEELQRVAIKFGLTYNSPYKVA